VSSPRLSIVTLLVCIAPAIASAQPGWTVVVASPGPVDPRAASVAGSAEAALSAAGETVLPIERAASRIEAEISGTFGPAPQGLRDRIAQLGEAVLEDVAFGRNQRALDRGLPQLAELDPFLPSLGREDGAANDIANLCLYLVRAHLQNRDAGAARETMRVCVRLVPDVEADEELHPAPVRRALRSVRDELDQGDGGVLAVHAQPDDPEGCGIRINGRRLGETPWIRQPLPPAEYAVQVECGERPGRIHRVLVGGGDPARLTIPVRFDAALVTRPVVALRYDDAEALAARVERDLASLARTLGIGRVLLVAPGRGGLEARAFQVEAGGATTLTGAAPISDPGDSGEAVASVLGTPTPGVGSPPPSEGPSTSRPRYSSTAGRLGAGLALTAVGLGAFATGLTFHRKLEDAVVDAGRVDPFAGDFVSAQGELDDRRAISLVATSTAGALLTVGLPLLLPRYDGVSPWWSWIVGAAGAGIVIAGALGFDDTTGCALEARSMDGTPTCLRDDLSHQTRSTLFVAIGAPLLLVPFDYLIASVGRDDDTTSSLGLDLGRDHAGLVWRGTF